MSDHWITLIPEDPEFVPAISARVAACKRLRIIAPASNEISITLYDKIQFFDCGGNFERVLCPSCDSEISNGWWHDRMDEDYEGGFKLRTYTTPCCNARHTLHQLTYDWPQGMGHFGISAMNASIGKLDDQSKSDLEKILGTPLRVIYRHF